MEKLTLRLKQAKVLFLISFFNILAKPFAKNIWVLCERGDDARDNAYWMYQYIKEHHPSQKVYYIIDSKSADYQKVSEDAIEIGSWKYFWALAVSEKIISTHYGAGYKYFTQKFFRYSGLGKKFYFLQHGITHNDMNMLNGENAPMRLFVCGAKPEFDWINENFHHPSGVVKYTGFARFDQLHNPATKRQILVMPTWRAYIKSQSQFLDSEYFKVWQSFLNNPELLQLLQKENYRLIFYPHYEVQKYIHAFTSSAEEIVVADFSHYDVQTLLKESELLISDYSSVMFDFAYMRKPVIYYQFDEDRFFEKHYKRGYFDYRKMGFGDVCVKELEVIEALTRICKQEMCAQEQYRERMDSFFPLYDTSNCERIYQLVKEDRI